MIVMIKDLKKHDKFKFNHTVYTVHKKYRNDNSPLKTTCDQWFHNGELEVEKV